jgi:hypothetical protein
METRTDTANSKTRCRPKKTTEHNAVQDNNAESKHQKQKASQMNKRKEIKARTWSLAAACTTAQPFRDIRHWTIASWCKPGGPSVPSHSSQTPKNWP